MITQAELKKLLRYDPETGLFWWKKPAKKRNLSKPAGSTGWDYVTIKLNKKTYSGHRLACLYQTGKFPNAQIDHIDGDKQNNRWKNLREATPAQNSRNRARSKNKVTPIGVSYRTRDNIYQATIRIKGDLKYLGSYKTSEKALKARLKGELKHWPADDFRHRRRA